MNIALGSIVGVVVKQVSELLVEEGKFLYGVKVKAASLKEELLRINSYLIDMENKYEEGRGNQLSGIVIKQVRTIAYDAEDLIESYILKVNRPSDNKLIHGFRKYACFCSYFLRIHEVGCEIDDIKSRINEALGGWSGQVVRLNASEGVRPLGARNRSDDSHINQEDLVVGLEEDIVKLRGVLSPRNTRILVLSIVEMGGSGKTTLARKLFNDKDIRNNFSRWAWVSVSQLWVLEQILQILLKSFGGEATNNKNEVPSITDLKNGIRKCLEGKRYIVVLDDVWEEQAITDILPALPLSDGSKIIVTTRNQSLIKTPDLIGKVYTHKPRPLSKEESFELFRKIALSHREGTDITELQELGDQMLDKYCRGLPLAVVALAGILSDKETPEEWNKVKNMVSTLIMDEGAGTNLYGPVNGMLELSYIDLPSELKPCFLYLARYPEDYEIRAKKLLMMWIVEGFINSDSLQVGERLEDKARRYLQELINRSLIHIASKNCQGKVRTIQVHDIVRELCIKKAKEEEFHEIVTSQFSNWDAQTTGLRRVAIYSKSGTSTQLPIKSKHLRSLVYEMIDEDDDRTLNLQLINENFKLLRVLLLDRITTSDGSLPKGIGSLIHLRYLGLKGTNISKLPPSIGNLRKLITLDYNGTENDDEVKIPDVLWKMEHLRHLYLGFYRPIHHGLKLHKLKHLETLSDIQGGSWMLEELPHLSEHIQKLYIIGITTEERLNAAFECPSIRSDRIRSLHLKWNEDVVLQDLERIIQCQHLRKLSLIGRIQDSSDGIQFPVGITKLVLTATQFESEVTLTSLGKLPNLVILTLYESTYLGSKWSCGEGEFPKLEELSLNNLPNLEEWSMERGAMKKLKELSIHRCMKLMGLPQELNNIPNLQKPTFNGMSEEFEESVREMNSRRRPTTSNHQYESQISAPTTVVPSVNESDSEDVVSDLISRGRPTTASNHRNESQISAPTSVVPSFISTSFNSDGFDFEGRTIDPTCTTLTSFNVVDGIDDTRIIEYTDEDVSEMVRQWNLCLVGAPQQGNISYEDMERYVLNNWTDIASLQIRLNDYGLFVFIFSNERDLSSILESARPWVLPNMIPLMLKRWCPGMALDMSCFDTVPIWVTLPNLDVRFWSQHMLRRIGSAIGTPLRMEIPTSFQGRRLAHPRILVEVSTNTQLLQEIRFRGPDGNLISQQLHHFTHINHLLSDPSTSRSS